MVKCKFKVIEKAELINYAPGNPAPIRVKLGAVQSEPFGKYTPIGNIEMTIINDEAAKQFEVGKDYYVDFTLAE